MTTVTPAVVVDAGTMTLPPIQQNEDRMSTINLTSADFKKTTSADGIVLVDFWAEWCEPCRTFSPIFEAASEQHPDVTFAKIDTETNRDLAAAAQIRSIPTLMGFRDGILVFRQAGVLPATALDNLIGQIRELDMDEVRKNAEQQAIN